MKIAKTIMYLAVALYCLCASFFVLASVVKVSAQIDRIGNEATLTLQSIRSTSSLVNSYTSTALSALSDPRNTKSLQAGLDVAATAKGSLLLVNRQVIPRAMRTLDELNDAIRAVNSLVTDTNAQINGHVLPATDQALVELQNTLKTAQVETKAGVEAITRLVSDPALSASLASLASASTHLDETTANIAEASKQMPSIAASIEKISKTSAKYRKLLLITQITSALVAAIW
jgi:hypothetical protein